MRMYRQQEAAGGVIVMCCWFNLMDAAEDGASGDKALALNYASQKGSADVSSVLCIVNYLLKDPAGVDYYRQVGAFKSLLRGIAMESAKERGRAFLESFQETVPCWRALFTEWRDTKRKLPVNDPDYAEALLAALDLAEDLIVQGMYVQVYAVTIFLEEIDKGWACLDDSHGIRRATLIRRPARESALLLGKGAPVAA